MRVDRGDTTEFKDSYEYKYCVTDFSTYDSVLFLNIGIWGQNTKIYKTFKKCEVNIYGDMTWYCKGTIVYKVCTFVLRVPFPFNQRLRI